MTIRLDVASTEACVWMSAGVLTYKLCDRHFECEHCPLDAALRGAPQDKCPSSQVGRTLVARAEALFPADRSYSASHAWLQPARQRRERFRFGLDGFAASLIPCPRHVRWNTAPRVLRPGETICALDFDDGLLNLSTPLAARLSEPNASLNDDPAAVVMEPYGGGWIAELASVEPGEWAQLLSAEAAQQWARLDLRRLRRRIALHLLADASDGDSPRAEGGEPCAKPWQLVGGVDYLEFMRELVH